MFETRVTRPEFMDSADCDPELLTSSYRFISLVNRFAGGTRAVRDFLKEEVSRNNGNRPIRILDIGSGICDIPLAITKWGNKRAQKIEFTCIEFNETALSMAAENIRKSGCDSIELLNASVLEYNSRQSFDYAIGSMFFHHYENEQILKIIEKLRSYVLRGVLINDLRRSFLSYMGCLLLVCPLSKVVRHDALLSIRKGFRPDELQKLLSRIEDAQVTIKIQNFSRLIAAIKFDYGAR